MDRGIHACSQRLWHFEVGRTHSACPGWAVTATPALTSPGPSPGRHADQTLAGSHWNTWDPRSLPGHLTLKPMLSHNHTAPPLETCQGRMLHPALKETLFKGDASLPAQPFASCGTLGTFLTSLCLCCLLHKMGITTTSQCDCNA